MDYHRHLNLEHFDTLGANPLTTASLLTASDNHSPSPPTREPGAGGPLGPPPSAQDGARGRLCHAAQSSTRHRGVTFPHTTDVWCFVRPRLTWCERGGGEAAGVTPLSTSLLAAGPGKARKRVEDAKHHCSPVSGPPRTPHPMAPDPTPVSGPRCPPDPTPLRIL